MAFAQAARLRPIEGAVATVGVSDRVAFLRKTYAHLGGALIAFALITAGMMKYMTATSLKLASLGSSGMGFLFVIVLFMVVAYGGQRLAQSETSRGLQYLGLGISVVLWSVIAQPMIWFAIVKFSSNPYAVLSGNDMLSARAAAVLGESVIVTLAIFIGLTVTVFLTKKDFTFMRGILSISLFALVGITIASVIFGFNLGMLYSGAVILVMSGYILYETSLVMGYFRPTQYVSAALMLFGTIVTLFIHVLNIVMSTQRR
jgi:FtsH-binding integral membrane protein